MAEASTRADEAAPMSSAASAAPPVAAPQASPKPKARVRTPRPEIDLDGSMRKAREEMARAATEVARARAQIRNDKKKKQRLVKKAGALSAQDLERMAVLKRCGLWSQHGGSVSSGEPGSEGGGSSSGSASAASSPVLQAAPLPQHIPPFSEQVRDAEDSQMLEQPTGDERSPDGPADVDM